MTTSLMSLAAVVSAVLLAVTGTATAGDEKRGGTHAYLERLQAEGKQRVIVRFTDQINLGVVKKHCKVKRTLKIINAVVCEIDDSQIDLLQGEPGVARVG